MIKKMGSQTWEMTLETRQKRALVYKKAGVPDEDNPYKEDLPKLKVESKVTEEEKRVVPPRKKKLFKRNPLAKK